MFQKKLGCIRNKRDLTSSSTRQLLQNNMGLTIYLEEGKTTNLVIFKAGKKFRSKISSCYKTICPHGVSPGMFSMVIVEISAESVKACSFHNDVASVVLFVN
jgi:hypothetical protein